MQTITQEPLDIMNESPFRVLICTALFFVLVGTSFAEEQGIPVTFTLEEPGYVTLVVEDQDGNRVRNLIQDTKFDAGKHTVWWDGYDLGAFKPIKKDNDIQKYYDVKQKLVEPGTFTVRGIVHKDIELKYEFSVQSPGSPPWQTTDKTGNWLADHTPPGNMIFLPDGSPHGDQPQVLVTSLGSAEAGHSAMWLTMNGKKLYGGKMRGWNAATAMAREKGPDANSNYYAYGLVKGRLYGFKYDDINYDNIVKLDNLPDSTRHDDWNWMRQNSAEGLAARNGYVLISFPPKDAIVFCNTHKKGNQVLIGRKEITDPRGLKYDSEGRLYLITGTTVKRFDQPDPENSSLGSGTTVIDQLEDPNRLTFGPEGNLFISDLGESHQVKVFTPSGEKVRTIGQPGGPQLGHYNEKQMSNPAGLTVDGEGKLWVAEAEYMPKRISVWDADSGEFIRAYYGPPKYGGDGRLDPKDGTKFYYGVGTGTIEFTLDWKKGTATPTKICYRKGSMVNNDGGGGPDRVVYGTNGKKYFAQGGNLFMMGEDGVLKKVAFNGKAGKHQDGLQKFVNDHPSLKQGGDRRFQNQFISWSDLNGDQKYQEREIDIRFLWGWGEVQYAPGLSIYHDRGAAAGEPADFTESGVPVWDLDTLEEEMKFDDLPYMENPDWYSTNYRGDHVALEDGFRVTTRGPIYGWKDGFRWTYHSQWPRRGTGFAPVPQYPGQLIATAQIIGTFNPPSGDLGPSWALNNDQGSIYLFTGDGLYLTDLGADARTTPRLGPNKAERGMIIDDLSFGTELFGPALTQINDQHTYLTVGHPSTNIFQITNLGTTRRLEPWSVDVTSEMLAGKDETKIKPADPRETKETTVAITSEAPTVDGQIDEWKESDWVFVNDRMNIQGAVAVSGNTLYAAWNTENPELLNNSVSDGWKYLFATGGGLDLMIRTDPSKGTEGGHVKHYGRKETARAGDVRLFVTRSGDPRTGSVHAVRFQQMGDGPGASITYRSPIDEVPFSAVEEITDQVKLAQEGGNYEVSIPMQVIGMTPKDGMKTKGDIGVLTGEGGNTTNRYYWNNKGASMVSDIPTESRLTPQEWGIWTFSSQ